MAEAVAQLQKGLALLSGVSDNPARNEKELNLQIGLGHALVATKGLAAHEPAQAFARARQLCELLNRPEQLGRVLYGQYLSRLSRGEIYQAAHHAGEMRHLGEASNDGMWKYFGFRVSGSVCFYLGKFIEARRYNENALCSWNPMFRGFVAPPPDPHVGTLIHLSLTLACLD